MFGKLFSEENNEFGEEKSLLFDDINVVEGNKFFVNNNMEKGSENDVRLIRINDERIFMGFFEEEEIEEMEDELYELNFFEGEKVVGIRNWIFVIVFLFLVKGINKVRLKGKRYLVCLFGLKYKWSDLYESMISGDDVDLLNNFESKIFEKFDSEVLLDNDNVEVYVKLLNDICVVN